MVEEELQIMTPPPKKEYFSYERLYRFVKPNGKWAKGVEHAYAVMMHGHGESGDCFMKLPETVGLAINEIEQKFEHLKKLVNALSESEKELAKAEEELVRFESYQKPNFSPALIRNGIYPQIAKAYENLVKKYSSVIHESDFENLDYILYLLETGRADTKKEALQLVDEERRNERLVEAVEHSAVYITANFSMIIHNLSTEIKGAVYDVGHMISKSIESMSKDNINAINQMSKDIGKDIEAMAKSINYSNMAAASDIADTIKAVELRSYLFRGF